MGLLRPECATGTSRVNRLFPCSALWRFLSSGTQVFTPASIAGLQLWLKADVGVYSDLGSTPATNGASVEQWNDQSGNGNNATQTTSGNRPVYATNSINGLPTVGCVTSGSTVMTLGSTIALSTGAFTLYAVGSRATLQVWCPVASASGLHGAPSMIFSDNNLYYRNDSDTGGNAAVSATGTFALRVRRDGGGNVKAALTGTSEFSLVSDANALTLGAILARPGSSNFGNSTCLFGEIVVYNVATQSSDDANMSTYFNSRWGVSLP